MDMNLKLLIRVLCPTKVTLKLTNVVLKCGKNFVQMQYDHRRKISEEEKRADNIQRDCMQQIARVREFWKEKIYFEGTRAGKMLKVAMET